MRIKVGELDVELRVPGDIGLRVEVLAASGRNVIRGAAAMVGLMWPEDQDGVPALKSKYSDTWDAMEYGGAVHNELLALGLKPIVLMRSAGPLTRAFADGLPDFTEQELEQAEGNSDAPTEP